jgi:hypothetical protein
MIQIGPQVRLSSLARSAEDPEVCFSKQKPDTSGSSRLRRKDDSDGLINA